jgi:CheY-like chemotaxis protein
MVASTRRVLVVEDESAIRGLVSMVLESEGYVADGASDGVEALAKVRRHPPDALIVDLDLPILNGCDLVRACRADQETRHLPIIAVSGVIGSEMTRELDVQGFLSKPFSLDTLLDLLRDLTSQDSSGPRTVQATP